jgi:hypothetical protein
METAHTVGSKYQQVKNLPLTDIVKLIRKDLKKFNDCKFSVRKANYTQITIELMSCNNQDRFGWFEGYKDKALRLKNDFIKEIKNITDQYNFDNSDSMSDYFHVNFYAYIKCNYSLLKEMENKINQSKNN